MTSPWSSSCGWHLRRRMVAAVLSPPTVAMEMRKRSQVTSYEEEKIGSFYAGHSDGNPIHPSSSCSLCHGPLPTNSTSPQQEDRALMMTTETIRTMMGGVGLELEDPLTFCPFCFTQLENLVILKKDIDKQGERLVTMMIGLQSLFSMAIMDTKTKKEPHGADGDEVEQEGPYGNEEISCEFGNVELDIKPDLTILNLPGLNECPQVPQAIMPNPPGILVQVKEEELIECRSSALCEDLNLDNPLTSGNTIVALEKRTDISIFNQKMARDLMTRYPCTVCKEVFENPSDLNLHFIIHTTTGSKTIVKPSKPQTSKKQKPFACPDCKKRFGSKYTLQQHSLIHTQGRRYPCTICSKSYVQRGNLERHVARHVPRAERPFVCHICSNRFGDKHDLKAHVRLVHPYFSGNLSIGMSRGVKANKTKTMEVWRPEAQTKHS